MSARMGPAGGGEIIPDSVDEAVAAEIAANEDSGTTEITIHMDNKMFSEYELVAGFAGVEWSELVDSALFDFIDREKRAFASAYRARAKRRK